MKKGLPHIEWAEDYWIYCQYTQNRVTLQKLCAFSVVKRDG